VERLGERELERLIEVGRTLVAELDLESVMQRVLEVACDLTGAKYAALGILDPRGRELERFITRGIDEPTRLAIGDLPRGRGVLGLLISDPEPLRLLNVSDHQRSYGFPPNHPPMSSFLGVPIRIRGNVYGNLYLTEKEGYDEFTDTDEQSAIVLAEWAAIAIDNARAVATDRLSHSILATERERGRWARELHDDTLQSIGALRVLLSSALQRNDSETLTQASREVVDRLGDEIEKLRALIVELRPAALDELGLRAALEGLIERTETTAGLAIASEVIIEPSDGETALDPDVESTVYRVVQEALTNVAKHARAEHVRLSVTERAGRIDIEVADDGVGLDRRQLDRGFGLTGVRERLSLVGGSFVVDSSHERGTTLSASIPVVPVPPLDEPVV
jgi:two-component system, NarL family, sensor histidine kinase DevS